MGDGISDGLWDIVDSIPVAPCLCCDSPTRVPQASLQNGEAALCSECAASMPSSSERS